MPESSCLVHCDNLLQNATVIFLQNISGVLLQNTTVITKCIDFISRWDSYYKMRRILQNASVHKVYLVALHEFPYCWDK